MADDILDAQVTPPVTISGEQLSKVMRCQRVNEPQCRAIISALSTPGFSLIQGPPGTGKTSTIVGLVGAFIASRPSVNEVVGGPESITRKILLCAPSNAAVDEVAKRLKEGVRGAQGELIIPKLVRIGADSKVNAAVKDIFIDELVESMSKESEPEKAAATLSGSAGVIQDLRQQIAELRELRDSKQIEAELLAQGSPQYQALQAEVTRTRRKIHELSQKIDEARDQQSASKRFLDAATRKLRMQILQDADVVCSTLSGSGHDYMSQLPFDFETVVIDEACQCVEPASLIPLRYNATQCIMVGDPLQLPPTVLSQTASRAGYDQSLFVRMHKNTPNAAHLLSIQYRMHPSISRFPSKAFYDSKLLDGPNMDEKTTQLWHNCGSLFPPYAFYHPTGAREERGRHHSLLNRTEASIAVAIYSKLIDNFPKLDFAYRVGIITGYSAQVGELRRQFRAKFSPAVVAALDINTVDGFQGQEKDIIILSCVRAGKDDNGGPEGGIGFLKDTRRMNVALTRAKSSLFIIGSQAALGQDPNWRALLDDAHQRGAFSEVTAQTFYSAAAQPVSRSKAAPILQPKRNVKGFVDESRVGALLTPKQISEQSQARAQIAKGNSALKRKSSINDPSTSPAFARQRIDSSSSLHPTVIDAGSSTVEPAKQKIASNDEIPASSSLALPNKPEQPEEFKVKNSEPIEKHTSSHRTDQAKSRPHHNLPSRPDHTAFSSSSSHHPIQTTTAQLPKKPAVNLFIKKTKRPPPPRRDSHQAEDPRGIRQRFQDELSLKRPPN